MAEAKSTLDKFDEDNRISETDLQAVQVKVNEAKELVAKAGAVNLKKALHVLKKPLLVP